MVVVSVVVEVVVMVGIFSGRSGGHGRVLGCGLVVVALVTLSVAANK